MRFGFPAPFLALLLAAVPAAAQELEERVEELERRNEEILERLRESEARNEKLADEVETLRDRERELLAQEIEEYLHATDSLAGGDAKGLETQKGAFVRLYGFLRLDAYYNTARMNSAIVPFLVLPEVTGEDDQFAFDARLTRLGFAFDFGQIGNFAVTGKLETDFANFPGGVPESRETPRIRVAYLQIDGAKWWLRLGQDWDVIAPLYPAANHELLMWNAGNLGDRRPMVRWFRKGKVTVDAALGLTGAINNLDLDGGGATSERDGFDAGFPHLQVRVATDAAGWVGGRSITVGAWGFVGGLETDTAFGGEKDFASWTGGLDWSVPVSSRTTVRGEIWYGQALGDMRGTIGQTIDTATGEEIAGFGGWIEVVVDLSEEWTVYVGGSLDDPENGDVPATGVSRNVTGYVGVRRNWSKTLRSVFDVIYWETQYPGGIDANAIRFNFWTSVDF